MLKSEWVNNPPPKKNKLLFDINEIGPIEQFLQRYFIHNEIQRICRPYGLNDGLLLPFTVYIKRNLLDRDIEELSKERIKRKDTAYNQYCTFPLISCLYLDKGFTNFLILRGSNFFILFTSLSCTNMEDTLHDHLRVSDMHSLRLE